MLEWGKSGDRSGEHYAESRLEVEERMPGTEPRDLGALLRRYRRQLHLTQAELAACAGVSVDAISLIERGLTRTPQRATIRLLSDALALAPEDAARFAAAARAINRLALPAAPLDDLRDDPPDDPPVDAIPQTLAFDSPLPVPLTALLGREREQAALLALLAQPTTRLLTLIGPAGVGKTRLALSVAEAIQRAGQQEVAFVELIPVQESERTLPTIARALGLSAQGRLTPRETLAQALRERRLLLLLDNFEQILPAAPAVLDLLQACPQVTALVTSRAPLNVRGERCFPVAPLPLPALPDLANLSQPAILDDLRQVPSVALFLERASGAANSGADVADLTLLVDGRLVADICIRLDGLPLAIELAAAQARRMGTPQLHARLTQPGFLGALSAGPRDLADHQRAMRSTIAWSYDLLAKPERRLFRWLGVFTGGASPDALAAVCELSGDALEASLAALVDASLLQRSEHAGEPRYTQLVTLRAYAQERLLAEDEAEDEWEEARRRHADYCLKLVETLDPDDAARFEQNVARVEAEYENVRAALAWALETGARLHGLRMVGALWQFWLRHPYYMEGLDWLERCVALATSDTAQSEQEQRQEQYLLAEALTGVMAFSHRLDHFERSIAAGEQALALRRMLGAPAEIATALSNLANPVVALRDFDRAIALYQECLALLRGADARFAMIVPLLNLSNCYYEMNRPQEALALAEESLALSFEKGEIDWARALTWATIGEIAIALDDAERAVAVTEPSYHLFARKCDTYGVAVCAFTLGRAEWRLGALERAAERLDEAAQLFGELGSAAMVECVRYVRASVALEQGDLAAVRRDLMAALDNLAGPAHGKDRAWWIIERAATLIALCGASEVAAHLLGAAIAQRAATPAPFDPAERALRARELERLRAALGADTCEERLAAGQALTLEAAIALARRELQRDMPTPIVIRGA